MLLLAGAAAFFAAGCSSQIHKAAATGDVLTLTKLLDADPALVNAGYKVGWTPLHVAAWNGRKAVAELLIRRGADVNAGDKSRRGTPLHEAVANGQKALAELLIRRGANVNAQAIGYYRGTPLHQAVQAKSRDMVELLLANGADVNARNWEDRTALDWAESLGYKDMTDLLRRHGAKQEKVVQFVLSTAFRAQV